MGQMSSYPDDHSGVEPRVFPREMAVADAEVAAEAVGTKTDDYVQMIILVLNFAAKNLPLEIVYAIFFEYGGWSMVKAVTEPRHLRVANGRRPYITLPVRPRSSI